MNKKVNIKVSTKALYVVASTLLIVAALVLPVGIYFFFSYIFDAARCDCSKINYIDTSFVLISLALGFAASSFSVFQIRDRYTELFDKDKADRKQIYSCYKSISFDERHLDLIKIIEDISEPFTNEFNDLFEKFKNSEVNPAEFFDKFEEIKQSVFECKLEKTKFEFLQNIDSVNQTIKSTKFIELLKRDLFDFEELSIMCLNLLWNDDDDVIYEEYIIPFVVSSFKKFLPFIFYFGLDAEILHFTFFAYEYRLK